MRARAQEGFKSDSFSAGTQGSVQKACSKILRQNRHQHDFTIGAHQPEMIWRSFHFWPHRMTKRTRPLGQKFVRLLVKLNQHWSHDLAPPQTSCRYSLRRQHIQTSTSTCISLSLSFSSLDHTSTLPHIAPTASAMRPCFVSIATKSKEIQTKRPSTRCTISEVTMSKMDDLRTPVSIQHVCDCIHRDVSQVHCPPSFLRDNCHGFFS